jgi:hypothetical protein
MSQRAAALRFDWIPRGSSIMAVQRWRTLSAHRKLRQLAAAMAAAGAATTTFASHVVSVGALIASANGGVVQTVGSCGDGTERGTLRSALIAAADGDTVDMSALSCSTITLQQGQLKAAGAITILGPADGLTIDAHHDSRVLQLTSTQTVKLQNLTLQNGSATTDGGGCIHANGTVELHSTDVHDCTVRASLYSAARGGGIFAADYVVLFNSAVTHSSAVSQPGSPAMGGGIWAGHVGALSAEVSYNTAQAGDTSAALGGGIYATVGASVNYSTMAHNSAKRGGAVYSLNSASISESTVSYNSARTGAAAYVGKNGSHPGMYIANATIATNYAQDAADVGGVFVSQGYLQIYSSIVASSRVTGSDLASLDVAYGAGTIISGQSNVITRPTIAGMTKTTAADPLISPLGDYGGRLDFSIPSAGKPGGRNKPTRIPLAGSPAFAEGWNGGGAYEDERGFNRIDGQPINIGAVQETIMTSTFDPIGEIGPEH